MWAGTAIVSYLGQGHRVPFTLEERDGVMRWTIEPYELLFLGDE
jgi:hypothetical protein